MIDAHDGTIGQDQLCSRVSATDAELAHPGLECSGSLPGPGPPWYRGRPWGSARRRCSIPRPRRGRWRRWRLDGRRHSRTGSHIWPSTAPICLLAGLLGGLCPNELDDSLTSLLGHPVVSEAHVELLQECALCRLSDAGIFSGRQITFLLRCLCLLLQPGRQLLEKLSRARLLCGET